MAPYSMDLRKRVARAWDGGLDADAVAAKYDVSRAWVHRLVERRRETGSIAPRKQTQFRGARPRTVLSLSSGVVATCWPERPVRTRGRRGTLPLSTVCHRGVKMGLRAGFEPATFGL